MLAISFIPNELDALVSKIYRSPDPISNFLPTPESLKQIHFALFKDSELSFAAGIYRTLPLKAGDYTFAPAYRVPYLMDELFSVERRTVGSILAWTIDAIGYIHPFLDGNRRTCWQFTNLWLSYAGYKIIDWDKVRPKWEQDILQHAPHKDRLNNLLQILKEAS